MATPTSFFFPPSSADTGNRFLFCRRALLGNTAVSRLCASYFFRTGIYRTTISSCVSHRGMLKNLCLFEPLLYIVEVPVNVPLYSSQQFLLYQGGVRAITVMICHVRPSSLADRCIVVLVSIVANRLQILAGIDLIHASRHVYGAFPPLGVPMLGPDTSDRTQSY